MLEIIKTKSYQTLSKKAALEVEKQILGKSNSTLLLPTGNTQIGLYTELVKTYQAGKISFKNAVAFNLDEYVGIKKENRRSFAYFMNKYFYSKIDIKKENIFIPDCATPDPQKEVRNYVSTLEKYQPIDLCLLGIGQNGHIGFNEPGSDPRSASQVVNLDAVTIAVNQGPEMAMTVGVPTILKSKKIILLASGKNKAKAIKEAIEGEINPLCPASYLQSHSNVMFILDEEAASLLANTPYFSHELAEGSPANS